jgi:hypothetical protein
MGTQRQHAAMLAQRTVQPALQLGVAVSYAEHWAGWPGKATVWSCWHLSVLSMLLPTGLICDLCTGTGQSNNQPAEEMQAGSKAISHNYLQCLQYQLCCTLHGAY